jgi:hypothetical protein
MVRLAVMALGRPANVDPLYVLGLVGRAFAG